MLFDGITLLAGSKIVNLAVNGGTSYPLTPVQGELFYRSDLLSLWVYNGTSWEDLTRKLGAGIAAVPSGEIGVDVHVSGGLMTTVDGTSSSTVTGAQLGLTLVGTAGTYYSVTTDVHGRVTAGSVGGGTAGQVFTSTGATAPVWSSTPTLIGTNFSAIPNGALSNSSLTIGSTTISLGASSTTLVGLTSVTSTTFVGALSGNATSATTAGSVTNALTVNNGGAGAASGTTFDGSAARTISYNTVGAPSTTGTGASGTWAINISGSAVSSTTQALDTADTTIATTAFVDRMRGMPSSATSGTAVIGDRGKMVVITAGLTVPNAVFAAGDTFSVFNNSAVTVTLTQDTGLTLRQAGTTNTGNRTIAAYGFASVWFLSSSVAIASGNLT